MKNISTIAFIANIKMDDSDIAPIVYTCFYDADLYTEEYIKKTIEWVQLGDVLHHNDTNENVMWDLSNLSNINESIVFIPTAKMDLFSTLSKKKIIDNHHCPNCGEALPCKGITDEYCSCCFNWKYCPECGQKLDWG